MRRLLPPLVVLSLALACGGDDGTGPAQYENIAGTYEGDFAATSRGVVLEARFTLTITQNQGDLGGSYSLLGVLDDGVVQEPFPDTGTISGTIAAGNNPSVNVTATSGVCPNIENDFSGIYDSANRRITISGTVSVYDEFCVEVLSYPSIIIILTS